MIQSTKARYYTPEEMNRAADNYCRSLRLIEAGAGDPEVVRDKDRAGLEILKMIEPLLLTYFRLLSGQTVKLSPDLKLFIHLFRNRRGMPDELIIGRITGGIKAALRGGDSDATHESEQIANYQGSDLYSWFLEILFVKVLPGYRVRYTDEGERINFFRYFQRQFCYALADRIKEQLGWEGRRQSLDYLTEEGVQVAAPAVRDLRDELGLTGLQWRYLRHLTASKKSVTRTRTKAQRVLESLLSGLLRRYRTAKEAAG